MVLKGWQCGKPQDFLTMQKVTALAESIECNCLATLPSIEGLPHPGKVYKVKCDLFFLSLSVLGSEQIVAT